MTYELQPRSQINIEIFCQKVHNYVIGIPDELLEAVEMFFSRNSIHRYVDWCTEVGDPKGFPSSLERKKLSRLLDNFQTTLKTFPLLGSAWGQQKWILQPQIELETTHDP